MQRLSKRTVIWATIAAVVMVTSVVGAIGLQGGNVVAPAAVSTTQLSTPSTVSPAATATPATSTPTSPHPGTLEVYDAGGPGTTEDPAVDYETVGYEVILNVYQTLIAYNGSSVTSWVPQLATCVPGSAQCTSMYGSSLVTTNASTGFAATYTFVIDSAARFYDPSTGANWSVYPSDVVFSLARTMGFANLPASGVYNGWIISQALLPAGNPSWDGGIHAPYNNTPAWIMSSMLVNDSAYCPSAATTSGNGCVTFVLGRNGADGMGPSAAGAVNWPFFKDLIDDPLGSSIVPQGWFTYESAGVPGFPGTTNPHGDGPGTLPAGATSSTSAAFQTYLSGLVSNPTSWDSFEKLAASGNYIPQPNVQWNMVGSGPYYSVGTIDPSIGYTLAANPAYHQPTGCAGQKGCEPAPGTYEPNVHVFWGLTDTTGIDQMQAGQADLAAIYLPADIATFDTLAASGKMNYFSTPSLSIFFQPINLQFNVSAANALAGTAGTTNVPGNFFQNLAVRQFLVNAVPYATVNATLLQLPGPTPGSTVSLGFTGGGAIPQGMFDPVTGQSYYDYKIPWPNQNPVTNPSVVGSAAWWWHEAITPGTPYYSAAAAACTSANPCTFPLMGEIGDTFHDAEILDLIGEIGNLTGGAVKPFTFDLSFAALIGDCAATGPVNPGMPGTASTNPCPLWNLGWAPDYPDPSDYTAPMYSPDATYTFPDSVAESLAQPQFNNASCEFATNYTTNLQAALGYYGGLAQLQNQCQGVAYSVANMAFTQALHTPYGSQRVALYTQGDAIMYLLGLYIWNFQATEVASFAPWINASSINTNVVIGGGGDNTWYTYPYTVPPPTPVPPAPGPSSTYLSTLAYGLIGLFVALTLIFLATTIMYARRGGKPPMGSPQSWTGSSGSNTSSVPPQQDQGPPRQ